MCVDYRRLNAIAKVEDWPFPVISDILDHLSESTYYKALDMKAGIGKFVWLRSPYQ